MGGIETVIAVMEKHSIGGDVVQVHPTWVAGNQLESACLAAAGLRRVLSLAPGSIVHVHLSEGGSFIREGAILKAASLRGHATVASLHGAEFLPFADRHRRLVAGVVVSADAITCLSPEVEAVVRRLAPRCDVEIVPNPAPGPERHVSAAATAPIVLFAGELGVRKGADVLAGAWSRVRREIPDARCLMVGPSTELLLVDQPGLELSGPVHRDHIAELVAAARVVALPSRAEGMPMLLTEALAAGRPFVSTPVGGIPSLAHSPGMLVPVDDADALADALVAYLADPELAGRVGDAGRQLWEETRSPAAVDRRLRAVYTRAAARAAHRSG